MKRRILSLSLVLLLLLLGPLASLALTDIRNYTELAAAAATNETAFRILADIDFTGKDQIYFFNTDVSFETDGDVYTFFREDGDQGRFLNVRASDTQNPDGYTLTVENLNFEGGYTSSADGGAISVQYSNAVLTNCTFSDNKSNYNGGAVYIANGDAILTDVSFEGNTARNGGGLYVDGTAVFYGDINFSDNEATVDGGGLYAASTSEPVLFHGEANFTNNTTGHSGGGAFFKNDVTFEDTVTFEGNTSALSAGGLLVKGDAVFEAEANFTDNTTVQQGGGAYFDASVTFKDEVNFTGNEAGTHGGGIYHLAEDEKELILENGGVFQDNLLTDEDGQGSAIYSKGTVNLNGDIYSENNQPGGQDGHGFHAEQKLNLQGNLPITLPPVEAEPTPSPTPTPAPTPEPTRPHYSGISYSLEWCWQLFLGDRSHDFRVHQLLETDDTLSKGEKTLFKALLSSDGLGGSGKQLSLQTIYDAEDPLLIALSPATLSRFVRMEISTLAMQIPKTGSAYVYDVHDLLARYEAAGMADVAYLWLADMGLVLELMDGTLVNLD